ncbi:MAG: hypothetical protein A2261_01645 [Candidatus Magasanikbacteria bacterium RIFOXYA2_FULL_44_8]|uniref:AI-2E family transporter n=1 Tax=Candidatus Magasanikbacteria bacterium RIFOXYA2_FULL_44_8 TaxID=1798696 RepID=A0A1F6NJI0_9BACT|nr:MAG: hypothetical protein A2261_01645 [Candidatus Magasanikbacteria bacterium RIFOXYA2_FULL_44_8]
MDFAKLKQVIFITLLGSITFLFLYIMKTFAYPILWAAIIAGLFYPISSWLIKKLHAPNLGTTITLVLVFLVIIIPITFVGSLVVNESINLYGSISNNRSEISSSLQTALAWVQHNPYTSRLNIDQDMIAQKFGDAAQYITSYLIMAAKNFTQNSFVFILMFVIMFYTLFFFVRDGAGFLRALMHLCPLGDTHEKLLYNRFTSTARATLKGSLIVGLIQGTLGGLMFWLAGIQGAMIWGILMVLMSTIPGIGSYFIWLPAAIVMIIIGKLWIGVAMILFGALVIGTIDNILRPILVGKDTQMHPLLVLFSTLGGIVVFGISGFVIGPVITSLLLAFWEMYEHAYRKELNKN